MPMVPKSKAQSVEELLSRSNDGSFRRDGSSVFCRRCLKRLTAVTAYTLKVHLRTELHVRNSSKWKLLQTQLTTDEFITKVNGEPTAEEITTTSFKTDLTKSFIAADIPLHKLNNKHIKGVFAKYTHFVPPSTSMARSHLLPGIYEDVSARVVEELRGQKLWVSVDESRDSCGRFVGAIVVRKLSDEQSRPYILNIVDLEATNADTICLAVDDALRSLGNAINRTDVLMLVTDGAKYMIKGGKCHFKISYYFLWVTLVV